MKQRWQWTVVLVTGFRIFVQAVLVDRSTYSACWMAPLLGFALALPAIIPIVRRWQLEGNTRFPNGFAGLALRWLALAYLLLDTAQMILLFQEAGQFSALDSYPPIALFLLLLTASLFVIAQNRNGVFGTGVALKSALWLFLSMLIVFRIPEMHMRHLAPLLGGGWRALLRAGLSTGGVALHFLVLYSVSPDMEPRRSTCAGMWATAAIGAAALAAMQTMLSTVAPAEEVGLYGAMGRLLANGRTSVTLQIPLYLTWFFLQFITICVNLKCMAAMFSGIIRREENRWIRVAAMLAVAVAAIAGDQLLAGRLEDLLQYPGMLRYPMLLLATAIFCAPELRRRRAVTA